MSKEEVIKRQKELDELQNKAYIENGVVYTKDGETFQDTISNLYKEEESGKSSNDNS